MVRPGLEPETSRDPNAGLETALDCETNVITNYTIEPLEDERLTALHGCSGAEHLA